MNDENLKMQLEEAHKTIDMLQNELKEMNRGVIALNLELEHNIEELEQVNKRLQNEIRKRKKAENKIKKYAEQLEDSNKELEAFSYSVSHDLRAPLRAIEGFSRIVLEDFSDKLGKEGKRLLNVIRNNTLKMSLLIDDLLSFSRLSRQELKMSDIDMMKLAQEVFDDLKTMNPERDIQLKMNTLPFSRGDRSTISVVLVNLLSNAVKFTRPRKTAVIECGNRNEENENVYYVKDNGVGFDIKYVDKIFDVFQRLHTSEEFEGTGIGLAIVQRIIYKHGGRVWAESAVDEGSTFYFTLPKAE